MLHSDKSAWDDSPWREIPPLAKHVEADVCVVGLGGSGLTCVNELLALGKNVVGIDAGTVGGGAAGRNGGFLLAGAAPFYHDLVSQLGRDKARTLYRLSLQEIDRIESATPEVVQQREGSLRIAASAEEEADCILQYEAMRSDDLPVEKYEGREGVGLLIPGDASFNPLMRCRLLASEAMRQGARLFENSRAVSIERDCVSVPGGSVSCDKVIVAVDGNLENIFPELQGRVRTARLQMLATEPVRDVVVRRPVYFRYGYDYWQQLPNGRVVVGGARDSEGDAEWTTDATISSGIQTQLEQLLRERIGVRQAVSHRWAALVSYTGDEMPLLEEIRPGVIVIGAYSGTGNVLGALYGRLAAQMATSANPSAIASVWG